MKDGDEMSVLSVRPSFAGKKVFALAREEVILVQDLPRLRSDFFGLMA